MKSLAATRVDRGKKANPIKPHNALALLETEQGAVLGMLRDYERRSGTGVRFAKGKLALRICHRLALLDRLEQEIFYPALQRVLDAKAQSLLGQARVEHTSMMSLVVRLEDMAASDPMYDPTVKVLTRQTQHHFAQERQKLFAAVRRSKLDLAGLGEQLAARELQIGTAKPDRTVFHEGKRVLGGRATSSDRPRS